MPADVDAPDKVIYGLTFRQLAILAVAAVAFYGIYQGLHRLVPIEVLVGAGVVLAGLAFGLAVGRRDGLPLDVWLLHAVRHTRAPSALSATDVAAATAPGWVEQPPVKRRTPLPAPLRLPAAAIADDGQITLAGTHAAVVAATTVNLQLRTGDEQAALIDGFGRWLNSLNAPTQIVVSAQPVDLASHAAVLADATHRQPHPALAAACADHAAFLADLAVRRDPLRRQVLVVTASTGAEPGTAARRRAEDTVRQLSGLGVTGRALDGPDLTAALAAAADPYRPPRPGGIAAPHTVITGPQPGRHRRHP
ncbi:PrgI family protein [Actinoplanes couchii]|nr:PrgI family protein [Actinoplanes couchii]